MLVKPHCIQFFTVSFELRLLKSFFYSNVASRNGSPSFRQIEPSTQYFCSSHIMKSKIQYVNISPPSWIIQGLHINFQRTFRTQLLLFHVAVSVFLQLLYSCSLSQRSSGYVYNKPKVRLTGYCMQALQNYPTQSHLEPNSYDISIVVSFFEANPASWADPCLSHT